jgi:sugar phosphate permease
VSPTAILTPRYRWTILAVGVAAQASLSAVTMGLPALAPALRDAFGLSLVQVGLLLASVNWGSVLTLIAWGALADRIGERAVIATGLAGGSLALACATLVSSFGGLLIALAITGGLAASSAAASGRAVMGWFGRSERGFALGIRQMAVPLGGAVGSLSLPLAVHLGGLDAALWLLAGGCALGASVAAAWIREPPPAPADRPKVDAPPPLRDRRVWRLAGGSALIVCAQVALLAFVVLFLHDERGVSPGAAAGALAAIQVGGALARLAAGRVSDRRGRRIAPVRHLALATVVCLTALAALADAPLWLLLPVLLLAGVSAMSWNGLAFTATAELAGRAQAGTALGLQGTILRLPQAGMGVLFGAFVASSSWAAAFAALAVLPLAGWLLLRPLESEEEGRIAARDARRTTNRSPASPEGPVIGHVGASERSSGGVA